MNGIETNRHILSVNGAILGLLLWQVGTVGGIGAAVPPSPRNPHLLAQSEFDSLDDVDYWRDRCLLQASAGKLEEALTSCEQAIALEPEEADLWALHSDVLLQQESFPEAIASAQRALTFEADNSLAWANQCIAYAALEQTETAMDACNEALRLNGSWGNRSPAIAWRQRGRILNQTAIYDQALTAYDRTLLLEPDDSITLADRCEVLINLGQFTDAIASCEQALAGNGNWGQGSPAIAWDLQGLAYTRLGQYDQAIAAYDQAISLNPDNFNTWTNQGWVLEQLDRPAEALVSYSRAVELQPDHARALVGQCAMLNRQEQYKAAQEACGQAIAGDNQWWDAGAAQAWNQQSHALAGLGQFEEALASVNRAVGIQPLYAAAWNNRAVILWYLERYDEAIASTNRAIQLDPAYALPWATQGTVQRALGQYDQALVAYERSLQLAPDVAAVWANRSLVLWHLGQYETAVLSANQAINLDNESFQGWYNRAAALVALSQYEDALESYDAAIHLDPENADAWTGRGLVLTQLDRWEEATAALQQAIALNANQSLAITALERLQEFQTR